MEGGARAAGTGDRGGASAPPIAAPPRPSRTESALAFLRQELASSPARQRATARILLSCAIATVLVATLQVPDGAWVVITIFVVSQPNAGATLQKGLHRLAGTLIACSAGLVLLAAFVDLPWMRVPIGGLAAGLAIFLFRTTTAPYAAILGGITFALFFLNPAREIEALVAFGLWRTLLVLTGVVIVMLVDLVLLPTDPERALLRDLEQRLLAVRGVLARVLVGGAGNGDGAGDGARVGDGAPATGGEAVAGGGRGPAAGELRSLVLSGLAGEIALLADAEARHRELRDRHPEQIVLIQAVERLATSVLALDRAIESTRAAVPGGPIEARLRAIEEGVAALAHCIRDRHAPRVWAPPPETDPTAEASSMQAYHALLPALIDMEDALRQGARALGFLGGPGAPVLVAPEELRSPLDAPPSGIFTPAFSLRNVPDLQVAFKAALAEILIFLVMSGTNWPGIQTGLVTVLVIAGASNGAMIHKAILRCAGAALGGLVGLVAILTVMPIVTTIAGLLPLALACFAVAAWITTGGPRICYVGVQAGIALALTLTDALGPTTNLLTVRDRVLGILIADTLTTILFCALWPVSAFEGMRRALAGTVRGIADLSRVGARLIDEELVRPARGFRWQVYQSLATTLSMHDEAAFEANGATAAGSAARDAVRRTLPLVQEVFLATLAVARHRLDVGLSAASPRVVEALRAYSAALGAKLDQIAARIAGDPEPPGPDLRALLDAAAAAVAAERTAPAAAPSPSGGGILLHAEARIALQRELLGLVERLDRRTSTLGADLRAALR